MSNGRFNAIFVGTVAAIVICVSPPALGALITLDTTRFGIYEGFSSGGGAQNFSHSPNTGSLARYDVGSSFSDASSQTVVLQHDYFVFDLTGVTGNVTAATLRIFSPGHPTQTHASDTLAIFDVTTPVNTLIGNPEGAGAYGPVFADLAAGTQYGSATLTPAAINAGTQINIPLTNALTNINAQLGSLFAVGGNIDPLNLIDGGGPYYLNGGTSPPNAQLILETSTTTTPAPIPEPATGVLIMTGVSVVLIWRIAASRRANHRISDAV